MLPSPLELTIDYFEQSGWSGKGTIIDDSGEVESENDAIFMFIIEDSGKCTVYQYEGYHGISDVVSVFAYTVVSSNLNL